MRIDFLLETGHLILHYWHCIVHLVLLILDFGMRPPIVIISIILVLGLYFPFLHSMATCLQHLVQKRLCLYPMRRGFWRGRCTYFEEKHWQSLKTCPLQKSPMLFLDVNITWNLWPSSQGLASLFWRGIPLFSSWDAAPK